jgi:hypothetical protein
MVEHGAQGRGGDEMSKRIITDYMAGRIPEKYHGIVYGEPEHIVGIGAIDDADEEQHHSLAKNNHDRNWSNQEKFDYFEREVPDEVSDSDDGMDKITDITQVRVGDIEVTKSGNRYKVIKANYLEGFLTLRVAIPDSLDGEMWLHDSAFAYALRPKPKVPTEPGLYFDSVKDVWELGGTLLRVSHRLVRVQGNFCVDSEVKSGGLEPSIAPYTRIDLERES